MASPVGCARTSFASVFPPACPVEAGPGSSSGVNGGFGHPSALFGWSWFGIRCLRAFGPPPAKRSLASAPRGTFLLAQESTQRRAPGFRPGTLLQGPRAGGAETRCAFGFAQTVSAFSRPEDPSARGFIRGDKVKTTAVLTFVPMDGGKVFQHPGHARPSALACRARQRAPGPCRMLMSAANRIRVTPASERCVSLRSTHPTARGLGQVRGHRRF
ncbi:hypothetical protein TK90_2372 [Thioalkalivibrio sp. K90mix]|nr:hypothetical protein TK90_2372 [Thioalkalivibrio sp. K90mix]